MSNKITKNNYKGYPNYDTWKFCLSYHCDKYNKNQIRTNAIKKHIKEMY
jgi:hypothetical protein